jgi:hypothetical protein
MAMDRQEKGSNRFLWVGSAELPTHRCHQRIALGIVGMPEVIQIALYGSVPTSLSAVSEAPTSEELGVEALWRGASDTAT